MIEVFADGPLKVGNGALRLGGTWSVSSDPDGWRYQLRGAEVVPTSALPNYTDLPQLAAALRTRFNTDETAKLLGGNYRRVFEASVG